MEDEAEPIARTPADALPASVSTGGRIPGSGQSAFRSSVPGGIPLPVLIAAPHGGRSYPDDLKARMRDFDYASLRLEDRHIDSVASRLAEETGAALLIACAPRAVLDLNRSCRDMDWAMVRNGSPGDARKTLANRRSRSGLGLIPRRLPGHGEIWKGPIDQAELDARMEGVHRPYHQELGRILDAIRDRWGAALLIDLHSMPPLHRRYPGEQAPEFVVGDRFGASCDPMLSARALSYFGRHGRAASHNRPYSGGYVLDRHGQPGRSIHAVQLEVSRSSYLDARMAEVTPRMPGLVRLVAGLVRDLAQCTAAFGREPDFPLAAE